MLCFAFIIFYLCISSSGSVKSVLTCFSFCWQLSLSTWTWPQWNQCDSLLRCSRTEASPSMFWWTMVGCSDCLCKGMANHTGNTFLKSRCLSNSSRLKAYLCLLSSSHAAGTMLVPERQTEDGFEFHFALNYLGHFLLTNLLLDLLKRSGRHGSCSRIVNMSSATHYAGVLDLDDLNRR